jgi:hypothetical protein
MNIDTGPSDMREQDITPDSKLPVCIMGRSGRLHRTDSPPVSFEEAKQFLHDLGFGAVYMCSGENFWTYGPDEGDFEPYNVWIGKSMEA